MTEHSPLRSDGRPLEKWRDATWTAGGERRARIALGAPERPGARTLWFNTGTLCNIACVNCYIESSPSNDRLSYLTIDEVRAYLDQIEERGWPTEEIGFTGGEPFLNPDMLACAEAALARGYETLILTNAMKPMMRPRILAGLLELRKRFGDQLILRVSLDHHSAALHDMERGDGAFDAAMEGVRWLARNGFRTHAVGRARWSAEADETEAEAREGFRALFARQGIEIDVDDPVAMMIFPEMDPAADPPEITERCWSILDVAPEAQMCASARMVVKRRGAARPSVLACTLLPYDPRFELGETLAEAESDVALQHPYCATFCVLGGARCSG